VALIVKRACEGGESRSGAAFSPCSPSPMTRIARAVVPGSPHHVT